MRILPLLAALAIASNIFAHIPQSPDSTDHRFPDVVVTGTRAQTDVRHLPYTVSVIDRNTLVSNNSTNLLPTLQEEVPGLFVTSRSMLGYGVATNAAGGISIRGLSGGAGQMLVLIDGHPQYQGVYGHPISDSYHTMIAQQVEVLRTPASVLYGSNAMGGVVNIVTRAMKYDGWQHNIRLGAGSYGTMQSELSSQVKAGRFSATMAANYDRTDNHRSNMGFEQYGGFLKLNYNITPHWNSYLQTDITHFNASNPGPINSPLYDARQWITRATASLAVENHYKRTSGTISIYSNFGRHKINDGVKDPSTTPVRYFRSKDALTGVSVFQNFEAWHNSNITIGLDYQHIYGHAYYTSIKTGNVLPTSNKQSGRSYSNDIATYIDLRQNITSWLTANAGLRLDHHSITGTEWIPQGGLVVRPMSNAEIKATVSKGFRNPSMREMYLYPPSNIELEPERLVEYELSWRHRLLENRFSYGLNLFYIYGDNMIQTAMIDGRQRNVNTGLIENSGAELEATWRINSLVRLSTSHSVLHMRKKVIAAPQYKGNLSATISHKRVIATLSAQQIAGLYTTVGGKSPSENYTLLGLYIAYKPSSNLNLWIKAENLLAQKYEIISGYPMPRATVMVGTNIRL